MALVDPDEDRRPERQADWPDAATLHRRWPTSPPSGLEVDAVEALLPIPLHEAGVIELLDHGWHVNLQKPMANDVATTRSG